LKYKWVDAESATQMTREVGKN